MGDNETGQVSEDAAKVYEEFFLPALFKNGHLSLLKQQRFKMDTASLTWHVAQVP